MNKIRLVAFDLDGTIGDTIPLCIKAFKEAVAPYIGHELSDDDVIRTFGLNEQGMIASLVEAYHRGSCNGKRCKEYPRKNALDLEKHNYKNVFYSVQSISDFLRSLI